MNKCKYSDDHVKHIFFIFDLIEKRNITSLNEKKEMIRPLKDYPEFKIIMEYVVKKDIVFHINEKSIKKAMELKITKSFDDCSFCTFIDLSKQLQTRKLSGQAALEAIGGFLKNCSELFKRWYIRIWLKDLRIGIGKGISKQVLNIKNKTVMKAKPIKDAPQIAELIKQGWYVEPKIDGIRMLTLNRSGELHCLTRNMKSLDVVLPKFEKYLNGLDGWVLDGELYNFDWSGTASLRRKVTDYNLLKTATYYVFDIFPVNHLENQITYHKPLKERKQLLKKFFTKVFNKYPEAKKVFKVVMPEEEVKSLEDAIKLSNAYVLKGYEGIMIKDKNSSYEFKRSNSWLKIKPMKTIDLLCVGINISSKIKDAIQSIEVSYKGKNTKVGSGFTLEQRKEFYAHPELVVGRIVEISYQEIGSQGRLRFPIFVKVREDKDTPDA